MTGAPTANALTGNVEDRLRDALVATAALVAVAPATDYMVETAQHGAPVLVGSRPERPPVRRMRWLAPVAAAAVVALVVGLFVVLRAGSDHGSTTLAVAGPSSPPYFLANITGAGNPDNAVSVRDARTGAVVSRIPGPEGSPWDAVSATADPHVFYLLLESDSSLYRLTLTPAGRVATLTRLTTLASGFDIVSLAASPDGTSVAYPAAADLSGPGVGGSSYGATRIDVVTAATGRHETFQSAAGGRIDSLSWDSSGRYLAFNLSGSVGHDGIWILDTHAGHDLLAASRRVPTSGSLGETTTPVLSADGRDVFVIAAQQTTTGDKVTRIVELEAATGKQLRVLLEVPFTGKGGNTIWDITLLALDPAGDTLLAVDGLGHAYRITVGTAVAQRFPFFGGDPNALAW